MFVRMVVLLLFHLGCAEYEENFQCIFDEVLLKFCCAFESGDNFCERVKENFELERNTTLSDDFDHEICCQKVQATDEFNYEVNDLN